MSNTFEVLKELIDILNENKIYFIIGGHTGLILQQVKIQDDGEIDICTDKGSAYKIQEILKKCTTSEVKYQKLDWFKAHWGVFKIKGVTVEVMGNPKRKLDDNSWRGLPKKNIITINFEGRKINVFTLESEYEYYYKSSSSKPKNKAIAEAIKKLIS